MGTKNNPGNFDCYENADPDEPMFILLARDPVAPELVRIWASIRKGDAINTVLHFSRLLNNFPQYEAHPTSIEKLQEAVNCSVDMMRWHNSKH